MSRHYFEPLSLVTRYRATEIDAKRQLGMNARLRGTWFSGPLSVGVGMAQAALRCAARAAIDSQDASVLSSRRLRPRGSGRAGHAPGLPGPASPQHLRAHTVAGARDRHGGRPRSAGPARGTEGRPAPCVPSLPSALRSPPPAAARGSAVLVASHRRAPHGAAAPHTVSTACVVRPLL